MPILESVFFSIIVKPAAKALFKLAFGDSVANEMNNELIDFISKKFTDPDSAVQIEKKFNDVGEGIARGLLPLFQEDLQNVNPEAVAIEVGITLEKIINPRFIIEAKLDATRLFIALREARPLSSNQFSPSEIVLYHRALKEVAPRLIALAPKMEGFSTILSGAVLSQLDTIIGLINKYLSAPEIQAERYESRYLYAVYKNLDYMELFGADLKPGQSTHELLSVAYVSLSLQQRGASEESGIMAERLFETLRPGVGRLLISGEAGSGKSTLFRWIATEAARWHLGLTTESRWWKPTDDSSTSDKNNEWQRKIPFLLRLRYLREYKGGLPKPQLFPLQVGTSVGDPPSGWVEGILKDGRALILIDGIDEVPPKDRLALRESLKDYFNNSPGNYFVLSTRPSAIKDWDDWLSIWKITSAHINIMSGKDREVLIQRWHEAMQQVMLSSGKEAGHVRQYGEDLIETLKDHPVASLAVYPLLCAMVCALHLWRNRKLPNNYWDLCEELCAMLLHKRDEESNVPLADFPACYGELDYSQKRVIVQRLANSMVEPEWKPVLAREHALSILREELENTSGRKSNEAELLLNCLIDRSSILREHSPEEVDFIHNTMKEFLASNWLVNEQKTQILLDNVANPLWEEIILFSAGHDRNRQIGNQIIDSLLNLKQRKNHVLALRCGAVARFKNSDIESRIISLEQRLFPPHSKEEASALAKAMGNTAVDKIRYRADLGVDEAILCIYTLRLIDTRMSRMALEEFIVDHRLMVAEELAEVIEPLRIPALARLFIQDVSVQNHPKWRRNVSDLTPLIGKSDIRKLDLRGTNVRDISSLANLPELQSLDLSHTPIDNIESLRNLKKLHYLDLNSTQVSDIEPLSGLQNLIYVYLKNSLVKDVGPIGGLNKLRYTYLSENAMNSIKNLDALKGRIRWE